MTDEPTHGSANWDDAELDWDETTGVHWDTATAGALRRTPLISEMTRDICDLHEPIAGFTLGGVTKETPQ